MASTAEIILNSFLKINGDQWTGTGISELLRGLEAAAPAESAASTAASNGSEDTLEQVLSGVLGGSALSAAAAATSSGSTGSSTLGKVVSTVFGSALGLAPLAKAIFSLFGGGSKEEEEPLVKYTLPPHLRFEAASGSGAEMLGVDYGQNGLARAQNAAGASSGATAAPAQVTVQVNAMDSRSFLDHKDEIARAVREAMLNMHALNDVVNEL
jgi:hypothetical protein